jgi:hypothetical protein
MPTPHQLRLLLRLARGITLAVRSLQVALHARVTVGVMSRVRNGAVIIARTVLMRIMYVEVARIAGTIKNEKLERTFNLDMQHW